MRRTVAIGTLALALAVGASAPGIARADAPEQTLAFYLFAQGLDGKIGASGLTADVDASFSDIFDSLEFGAAAAYQASWDPWGVSVDVIFNGLGATKDGPGGASKVDVDVDQWLFEVDASYRVGKPVEILFGGRYNRLDTTIALSTPLGDADGNDVVSWVDPVLGARVTAPLGKKWSFVGRGDFGGFGLGSDFTWQAVARFNWKATEKLGMSLGYRILDIDYDEDEKFLYDMQASGPVLALTWSF